MHPTITIVLASCNGARHIGTQLDSIAAQTVTNWRLLVSDDGSRDATRQIVQDFARGRAAGQVELIDGPCRGATANFLHATRHADPSGWLAFADQDDQWFPERLQRGVEFLVQHHGPAVHAARTMLGDQDLRPLGPAPHLRGPFGFRNALIQACLPGNTILANAEALQLLQAGAKAADAADVVAHDWWAYQLLAGAGAHIRRDPAPALIYRQHGRNLMGRNDTFRARALRAMMLHDGHFADWLGRNQRALEPMAGLLLPENRELLQRFGQALRASGPRACREFMRMRLYRQTSAGTLAVLAAALAGRLRQR
ncbi:glycosyltransferase [Paracoccus sp. (in: a-proteobacteria)]|uniref:glycosyltransferase n=1 Tax=Paracoccus sp. TaxID=267 RepID=UPI00321FFFA7